MRRSSRWARRRGSWATWSTAWTPTRSALSLLSPTIRTAQRALIDTQIATIKWASNALNVWAQGILQGNSSGYVPSFNLDFYGQQLGLYFEQFNSLIQEMKTKETLREINELMKEKDAIDASAEESTTMVSMGQTIDTIESAASGMSYALQAMKRLNATIVQAGFDFQDALDEYYAQKRREAIWNLAFGVANLCTGGVRTFANMLNTMQRTEDRVEEWRRRRVLCRLLYGNGREQCQDHGLCSIGTRIGQQRQTMRTTSFPRTTPSN